MESVAPELYDSERKLEADAVDAGYHRYMALVAKTPERTPPGMELIRRMIKPTAAAIEEWVKSAQSGKAARQAGLAHFVAQLPSEEVAFIVARAVVAAMCRPQEATLTRTASSVTINLEAATMGAELHAADPKAWRRLATKVERASFPGKRFVLVRDAMGKARIKRIEWGRSERAKVGALLITLCSDASGVFTVDMEQHRLTRRVLRLVPTPEARKWMDEAHRKGALMAGALYPPMVVPPKPWSKFGGGGYLTAGLKLHMINGTVRPRPAYVEEMKNEAMPMVYKALNAVQATPWRINTRVLDVMREVWDNGGTLGKLPARDNLPLPDAPWGDGTPPSEEALKSHKAARGRIHEINDTLVGKRMTMAAKLNLAERYKDYEAIYFPHVIDWRGRMYAVPVYVNPQADDSGRSLIEFANGCALGDDGAFWLAVHGANCYGIDKVSFAERVKWVEDNQDAILDSARKPLDGDRFWSHAEDPYLFLAFCFEWADLMAHVGRGESQESFVSTLPVSWDGSCNGLQNFSAMLRDPIGGAATNLVPSDQPADIYQRVADVANVQVNMDAAQGEVNARYWQGKVTRKIAKRPTMTLPYGSGRYGFRDQLREELDRIRLDNGNVPYIKGDEFLCSIYMANVLYDALGQVVVAARQAMDWLKEVSRVVAEEDLPIWWTAPSGFRPMQDYRTYDARDLELYVNGRRLQLRLQIEGQRRDKRKQQQGISPNFVHSLDAAHLARTVSKCVDSGVGSYAMVHDSYGTHAGNASALHQMLREAFVEQYSGNTLLEFHDELAAQLSPERRAKLPPPPPMGDLDLTAVLRSEYFFA